MFQLLLVDDEYDTALYHSYEHLKQTYGEQNVSAEKSGEAAINLMAEKKGEFDLIILDEGLIGGESGTEVGTILAKWYPYTSICLLTGQLNRNFELCRAALRAGFCDFLLKQDILVDNDFFITEIDRVRSLPSYIAKQTAKQQLKKAFEVNESVTVRLMLEIIETILAIRIKEGDLKQYTSRRISRCFGVVEDYIKVAITDPLFTFKKFCHVDNGTYRFDKIDAIISFLKTLNTSNENFKKDINTAWQNNSAKGNRIDVFLNTKINKQKAGVLLQDELESWPLCRRHSRKIDEILNGPSK